MLALDWFTLLYLREQAWVIIVCARSKFSLPSSSEQNEAVVLRNEGLEFLARSFHNLWGLQSFQAL